jgi:hypothetical protein
MAGWAPSLLHQFQAVTSKERASQWPLPAAFGVAWGSSRLALQLADHAQPHRRDQLVDWSSGLAWLHQQDMGAELLHGPTTRRASWVATMSAEIPRRAGRRMCGASR